MGKEEEQINIVEEKETDEQYFFDSSAIIEILKENPLYNSYKDNKVVITLFNLAEIYYVTLSEYDETKADNVYAAYHPAVINLSGDIIKDAMKFRKINKNKGFSYADSIGYICAKRNNMKFLTSDSQFKDLDNVEFVK